MATIAIKGSDIGTTVDIETLASELNNHPNGGFVFISKYLSNEGVLTDQWIRLCPTSEQRGAGYAGAKASDLAKIEACIEAIEAGDIPSFGDSLRIRRGAKFAISGHKDFSATKPVEVSANTKKFCTSIMQLDYPIPFNDQRVITALVDIQRSITNPSQTGQADYQGEGDKGLFTLDKEGRTSFYLRECYAHYSCESKDENGVVLAGYKEKTTTEAKAVKDAIGKALELRRDKYRTFKLSPEKFDSLSIAKKVITMDGANGEFSVVSPETAKDWLGVAVDDSEIASLLADIQAGESVQA
jgi:hypothetical protein